jgi:hypothetical protein
MASSTPGTDSGGRSHQRDHPAVWASFIASRHCGRCRWPAAIRGRAASVTRKIRAARRIRALRGAVSYRIMGAPAGLTIGHLTPSLEVRGPRRLRGSAVSWITTESTFWYSRAPAPAWSPARISSPLVSDRCGIPGAAKASRSRPMPRTDRPGCLSRAGRDGSQAGWPPPGTLCSSRPSRSLRMATSSLLIPSRSRRSNSRAAPRRRPKTASPASVSSTR